MGAVSNAPLPLPPLLEAMIQAQSWPHSDEAARRQNLTPLVSRERVFAATSGDEGRLSAPTYVFLDPPPFRTVAQRIADSERQFWLEFADPEGIVFERTLVIGDFGLGSDAPIVLDYRVDRSAPTVLRLSYGSEHAPRNPPRWVPFALTFNAFVDLLGLSRPPGC